MRRAARSGDVLALVVVAVAACSHDLDALRRPGADVDGGSPIDAPRDAIAPPIDAPLTDATAAPSITELVAGTGHFCALTSSRRVLCWGANDIGQLGDGTTVDRLDAPMLVLGVGGGVLENVLDLAARTNHTCAVHEDGGATAIACWGQCGSGQNGDGNCDIAPACGATTCNTRPVHVRGITTAVEVAAGGEFACARVDAAPVQCWGDDTHGQLGNGAAGGSPIPVDASTVATTAIQLVAGSAHACVLQPGGQVACWGQNYHGQLGTGMTTTTGCRCSESSTASRETMATSVIAGGSTTFALHADGSIRAWGWDDWGQLGDGVSSHPFDCAGAACSPEPVTVTGIRAREVAASERLACAIDAADSSVWCWGANDEGQLGDAAEHMECGATPCSRSPVRVLGVSDATEVAVSNTAACALTAGGVYCWGQLGNPADRTARPIAFPSL